MTSLNYRIFITSTKIPKTIVWFKKDSKSSAHSMLSPRLPHGENGRGLDHRHWPFRPRGFWLGRGSSYWHQKWQIILSCISPPDISIDPDEHILTVINSSEQTKTYYQAPLAHFYPKSIVSPCPSKPECFLFSKKRSVNRENGVPNSTLTLGPLKQGRTVGFSEKNI